MEIDFSPKSYKKFVTVSASFHNPRSVMRKAKEMGAVARLDSETCYSIRFDEPSPSATSSCPRNTPTTNFLSWSGPDSFITL